MDRLKPHRGDGPLQAAWPPRRGRPVDESRLLRAGSEGGPVARVYIIVIRQYCTYLVRQFMCAGEIREILLFSILFCC